MAKLTTYRIWPRIYMMDDSISSILAHPRLTPVQKVGMINRKMRDYGIGKLLEDLKDLTESVGEYHIETDLGEYGLTRKHQIEAMMILGKYTNQQIFDEYETNSTIIRFVSKLQNKFPTFSLEDKSTNDDCDNIVTLTIYGTDKIPKYYSKLRPYIFEAGFIASPILQQHDRECFTKCFKPVEAEEKEKRKALRVKATTPMGWICCDSIYKTSDAKCEKCGKPNPVFKPNPAFKHNKSIQKTKRSRKQTSKKRKNVKKNKSLKKK